MMHDNEAPNSVLFQFHRSNSSTSETSSPPSGGASVQSSLEARWGWNLPSTMHRSTDSSFMPSPNGLGRSGPIRIRRHDPYAAVTPGAYKPQSVMQGTAHQPLRGQCDYVTWPTQLNPVSKPPSALPAHPSCKATTVTITQVKFEMSGPQLRWLMRRFIGVAPIEVISIGEGRFEATFAQPQDAAAACTLSHTVLFDHHGVWVPTSAGQAKFLQEYLETREFRQRSQRLPRELMRVLRAK